MIITKHARKHQQGNAGGVEDFQGSQPTGLGTVLATVRSSTLSATYKPLAGTNLALAITMPTVRHGSCVSQSMCQLMAWALRVVGQAARVLRVGLGLRGLDLARQGWPESYLRARSALA